LKELFRIGRYSVAIGLIVFALCVIADRIILRASWSVEFGTVLNEGLAILGWVTNWRPIEIFLYDW